MHENQNPTPVIPPAKSNPRMIITGFCSVVVLCLLSLVDRSGAFILSALFVIPIVAVILAIIPSTRKFGLGALLGCGVGALILLAICGGMMKFN